MESSQWSAIPIDILQMISKRLQNDSTDTFDLLRLRSVCATWHLFLPLFGINNDLLSKFPKLLPFWSSFSSYSSSGYFSLKESTVYKLETYSTSWLVKLQETSPRTLRVLDLFSNDRLFSLPENFPKKIYLHESHLRLVRKTYRLEYTTNNKACEISCFWSLNTEKAVILTSGEDSALMVIHSGGKLGFLKSGNEERWRILDDTWNVIYEDMISYGEYCIVVDNKGKTVIYDVDFNVSELAGGLAGGGGQKKYLVEYPGREVFLVDKYVKHIWCNSEFPKSVVEFRVYNLKREENKWEEVRELGDLALFIGEDCSFSVAGDLVRGCIFYRDYRNGGRIIKVCCNGDGVFNVEYEIQGDFVFPY